MAATATSNNYNKYSFVGALPQPPSYDMALDHIYGEKNSNEDDLRDVASDQLIRYNSTSASQQRLINDLPANQVQGNDQQGYQQIVLPRFVCIIFLLGCCTLLWVAAVTLGLYELLHCYNRGKGESRCGGPILHFIPTVSAGGILPLSAVFLMIACCFCLGMRRPKDYPYPRVFFDAFVPMLGSFIFTGMLSATLISAFIIRVDNSTGYGLNPNGGEKGYLFFANTIAAIFGLTMLIIVLLAYIRDPHRNCTNQFIKMCVHTNHLLIISSLILTVTIPPLTLRVSILEYGSKCYMRIYAIAAVYTTQSAVCISLVFLLNVCLIGPMFCIPKVRNSPLFSTILKYSMSSSVIITFFNVGMTSFIMLVIAVHLSDSQDCWNDLTQSNLRPAVVVALFSFSPTVMLLICFGVIVMMFFLCLKLRFCF